MSGFMSNTTLLLPKQDLLMVFLLFISCVVQKALLVKVLPRGVCRRLSIVFDYDGAPDFRSYCYF